MKRRSLSASFFATKNFSFVIALLVAGIVALLTNQLPSLRTIENLDLDINFRLKDVALAQNQLEGVTSQAGETVGLNSDILIIGVDDRTLAEFGRWPFPRYRHANLINSFTRIQDQSQRESAVMLDFFFIDATDDPVSDALLRDAIAENGRAFAETVPIIDPYAFDLQQEMLYRFDLLLANQTPITKIQGNWLDQLAYLGMDVSLPIFSEVAAGFGHAIFAADADGSFRRQQIVLKFSEELTAFPFELLKEDASIISQIDFEKFQRLGYLDVDLYSRSIPLDALNDIRKIEEILKTHALPRSYQDEEGNNKLDFFLRVYQDRFVPAITLRLAANYLHVPLDKIEVVFGSHVLLPSPQIYNPETRQLEPYKVLLAAAEYDSNGRLSKEAKYREVPEIRIPIDEYGNMLVNFRGRRSIVDNVAEQTFPVRSYSSYAYPPGTDPETWPTSQQLQNRIVLGGMFSKGAADDEKLTPFGLMYGVEIHANALNTILTDNFISPLPVGVQVLLIVFLALLVALYAGRTSTPVALAATALLLVGYFFLNTKLFFEANSQLVPLIVPSITVLLTFLVIVVYRVLTEEKDKARIRDMFGKYVSPGVVNQLLELPNPPELGGVDKELTVLFSDIRGFTTLSESMTPQELVNHLNLYLTAMTDIIHEYQGTLDKYVGDEIMCFWGAPLPQQDHALLACKCALRQIEKLNELNAGWPPERQINIGIGINSGIMTVGNMGSLGRMNYTLMGDNVNLGARLEGTNKSYLTQIIISEYTYGLVRDKVICRELDNIRVKGKNKPVLIYELLDVVED